MRFVLRTDLSIVLEGEVETLACKITATAGFELPDYGAVCGIDAVYRAQVTCRNDIVTREFTLVDGVDVTRQVSRR